MRRLRLPRRTLLRGAAGAAIALPLLEMMLDDHGTALAGGQALPRRYLVCFGGFPLTVDGLPLGNSVVPTTTGPGYELGAGLAPIGVRGVHDEVTVVSGLSIPTQSAEGAPVPAGGRTRQFHAHVNPVVSGNRSLTWATDNMDDSTVTGPSSDQIVADVIAGDTAFRSLTYRAQALLYNTGAPPQNAEALSWREMPGGEIVNVAGTTSPRQAYDSLFLGFVPTDPAEAAAKALEIDRRKSILDIVDRRMSGLLDKLSAADKARMQRHYDEIRALEMRLNQMPPEVTGACQQIADPGADPPLGGEFPNEQQYDVNVGYSGEDTRLRVFCDLLHMAFTCDLTRSASLLFTMFQSFINVHPFTGHPYALHDVTHSGYNHPYVLDDVIAWHVDHFAYLVGKLRDTAEGDGTLLDNSALVLLTEGGAGYGYENGSEWSAHSTDNMITLVAGGAGGLVRGEHIVAPESASHPGNVVRAAMQAVGVDREFGEIADPMPGLLG